MLLFSASPPSTATTLSPFPVYVFNVCRWNGFSRKSDVVVSILCTRKAFQIISVFFLFFSLSSCEYIMYYMDPPKLIYSWGDIYSHQSGYISIRFFLHKIKNWSQFVCVISSPFRIVILPTPVKFSQLIIMWLNTSQPIRYLISNVTFPWKSVPVYLGPNYQWKIQLGFPRRREEEEKKTETKSMFKTTQKQNRFYAIGKTSVNGKLGHSVRIDGN